MKVLTSIRKLKTSLAAVASMTLCLVGAAHAERFDDGLIKPYQAALKGKRVAFVPISMTLDLARGWHAGMKQEADRVGYQLIVRDPNWKVDVAVQAADQLINEKPDVLVLHSDDLQAFNRQVKKAHAAGILVIQLALKPPTSGDAFIGPDWYDVGQKEAAAMVKQCGQGSGKSGQVAIIHGPGVSAASRTILPGIEDGLAGRKDIKVVARQSGDWDANKARSIAATLLKQNPKLCGFIGLWEGQDIGIANAVRQAGLTGKVAVVTMGGGNREAGCNQVASDGYTAYVLWDVRGQVRDLNSTISMLLQTKPKPGSAPFALYTPVTTLTKASMKPNSCWTVEEIANP
jgi:ABC-type sugar transport system substrate-binding protein